MRLKKILWTLLDEWCYASGVTSGSTLSETAKIGSSSPRTAQNQTNPRLSFWKIIVLNPISLCFLKSLLMSKVPARMTTKLNHLTGSPSCLLQITLNMSPTACIMSTATMKDFILLLLYLLTMMFCPVYLTTLTFLYDRLWWYMQEWSEIWSQDLNEFDVRSLILRRENRSFFVHWQKWLLILDGWNLSSTPQSWSLYRLKRDLSTVLYVGHKL